MSENTGLDLPSFGSGNAKPCQQSAATKGDAEGLVTAQFCTLKATGVRTVAG